MKDPATSPLIAVVPSLSVVASRVARVRLVKLFARSSTSWGREPAGKRYLSRAVRVVAVISASMVPAGDPRPTR
ncbi:hypothetical protein STENM36S_01275 [Streptomyces tendae]